MADLEKVINSSKTVFSAAIYKGHFEHGGQKLGMVQVIVKKILFSAKLNTEPPPIEDQYLVFGAAGAYFGAHLIQGKPSFDAIASLGQPYELLVDQCRTRACSEPETVLIPDSELPLTIARPSANVKAPKVNETLGGFHGAVADIQKVSCVEEAELAD